MRIPRALAALAFMMALPWVVRCQDIDAEVAARVRMVEEGRAGQVKSELPSLVAKYQNHPGVLYLQGRLASNGTEAARYYQMIIDNFPKSEWADDALYRIYLYYYSLGLARTAELKMLQLRQEYPSSPFARERSLATRIPVDTVQAIPDFTTPIPPPPRRETRVEVSPPGDYAIQVGAFSSAENAARLKSFFEDLGYPVEMQNKVRSGRSLYLVWVGRFNTANEARKFGADVRKKHNIESMVVGR